MQAYLYNGYMMDITGRTKEKNKDHRNSIAGLGMGVRQLLFQTRKREETGGKSTQCFGMGEVSVLIWKDQEAPAHIGHAIMSLWAQNNKSK
jgi:hypothetical protein